MYAIVKKISVVLILLIAAHATSKAQENKWFSVVLMIDDQFPLNEAIDSCKFIITFKDSSKRELPFEYKLGVLHMQNIADYTLLRSEKYVSQIASLKVHFLYWKNIPVLQKNIRLQDAIPENNGYAEVFLVGLNLHNYDEGVDARFYTLPIDKNYFSKKNEQFYFWRVYNNSYQRVHLYRKLFKNDYRLLSKKHPEYKPHDPMGSFFLNETCTDSTKYLIDSTPIPTHIPDAKYKYYQIEL